jgi:phosphate transport system substrate-binding protein
MYFLRLGICLCFCGISALAADVVGSDLVNEIVVPGISKISKAPTVELMGTLPARRALASGKASMALIFVKEGDTEPTAPDGFFLNRYLWANSAAVVVVHRNNPFAQINLEELKGIFAKESRVPFNDWSDFRNGNLAEPISPLIYSPVGSFTQEYFQGFVLGGEDWKAGVRQRVDWPAVLDSLAARFGIIAVMPGLPAGSPGKVLPVSDGREGRPKVAYLPDEMNIYTGDYPLRLPLYLYVRTDKERELREVMLWLFSDEVADKLRAQGLYPCPKAIRARLSQRLDR